MAQSYLRHADFWSEDKDSIFRIDSSWIPNLEAAIKWYDKVISEFPKSAASRRAYEGKLRALIGWKDPGQYGETHGVKGNFAKYMPQLDATFAAFEADQPDAGTLQAFRYQIAQAYWSKKDWAKTREWLNTIGAKAGAGDSFYKDLAERRLAKVEFQRRHNSALEPTSAQRLMRYSHVLRVGRSGSAGDVGRRDAEGK